MDPGWDHTENEDKLLLAQTLGMDTFRNRDMGTNVDSVVYRSEVRSVSGIGCTNNNLIGTGGSISEYPNQLLSVVSNILNANQNSLSTLDIRYITYFYTVFPLHPNTFHQLFYTHTLPGIERLMFEIHFFNINLSPIISTQIKSLCKFQSIMSEFQSDFDCDIQELNSNIDHLMNFNSFVTKCVKSYLYKYITCLTSHYNSWHKSVKQNIETFECIKKCVKTMLLQLNRNTRTQNSSTSNGKKTIGSERYVKGVFSNVLDSTVSNAFSYIKINLPLRPIRSINFYFENVPKFLDESNPISKTTGELGHIKNYLSQFSGHIGNYTMRIPLFLINPLSSLISSESTIKLIGSSGNGKNANGIYKKYQEIKHKVVYCKSSLQFEKERLESISKNAKMLEEHLGKISRILNKYKNVETKLKEFREKVNKMKTKKEASMNYLKCVVKKVMSNFCEINRISNRLNSRKESVSITTIKNDVALINSDIKDINNILSVIKSHLEYLFGVNLGVDCKIVNEVESCILEIVCEIHGKYCCISSDISKIFIDQPSQVGTLGESCKFCEIVKCTSSEPTCSSGQASSQTCGRCQGDQGSPGCQKTCEGLQQLLSKSSVSNIERKLECINKIVSRLENGQKGKGSGTCRTQNHQCSQVCQKGQPQSVSTCETTTQGEQTNSCQGTNIRELIKCTLGEINKFQSSSKLTCQGKKEMKCTDPPTNGCQATRTQGTTNCPASTSSSSENCNQLDKVKLCIDTMINKCSCCNLKELINGKNIKSCVDVFKWVMITNFRELFSLYLCLDKSLLDQISCYTEKLEQMRFYVREMLCIQSDIKCWIDYIKKEITEIPKQFKILENTMKLGIREMECAIEGVARNLIRCSTKQLSTHLINLNTANNNRLIKHIGDVEVDNRVMSMYSVMSVMDYGVVVNRLYDSAKKIDQILQLVPLDQGCQCILRLESKTNNKIILQNIYLYNIMDNLTTKTMNEFLKFLGLDKINEISRLGLSENHLCLCMVIKYILYPKIISTSHMILGMDLDALSTISRKFQKYNNLRGSMPDVAQFLIIMINLLDSISNWIRTKYYYTMSWTSGGNGIRVDVKCFCCYYQDRNYYGVVSTILVLSSLIENIWSMDTETIGMAIESLSILISEFDMIAKDDINVGWNDCKLYMYRIMVSKYCCPKSEIPCDPKCCCVSCLIVILMSVYMCISYNIKSKLCPSKCPQIKQRICCLIKLLCNSKNTDCQNLLESCTKISNGITQDCCQKLLEKCQEICQSVTQNSCNFDDWLKKCTELCNGVSVCKPECICSKIKQCFEKLCKSLKECKLEKLAECIKSGCKTNGCKCPKFKVVVCMIKLMKKNMVLIEYNMKHDIKFNSLTFGSVTRIALYKNVKSLYLCYNKQMISLLKNNVITSTRYPYSVGSYPSKIIGVTNVETRNWGYDTKYEHDVSNDNSIIRSDGYPYVTNPDNTESNRNVRSSRVFKIIISRMLVGGVILFMFIFIVIMFHHNIQNSLTSDITNHNNSIIIYKYMLNI